MKKVRPKDSLIVFLIVLLAYGYFFTGSDANTNSRLALVRAVVEQDRFEIDSFLNTSLPTGDRAYFHGHYYSDKAIGSSVFGVLPYVILLSGEDLLHRFLSILAFKELLTFLVVGIISAILAPLVYLFTKQVTESRWYALLITAGICLGTPYYVYSTMYYGHTLAGLFLFSAFYTWFEARAKDKINLVMTIGSGFFLGLAVITEYPTLLIVLLIGLYIAYILLKSSQLRNWKNPVLLVIGASIPIVVLMAYNCQIFKTPFALSYSHESSPDFASIQDSGLMGIHLPNPDVLFYMTFHTTMGIFWQSPILLFAFADWLNVRKNPRYLPESVLSFAVILLYFGMFSGYQIWWGGLAFTPRHLIPVLPFFSIPLALLQKRLQRWVSVPVLFSIGQMFIVTASSRDGLSSLTRSMHPFYRMFQNSTIYDVYFPNFLSRALSLNWGEEIFRLKGYESLIPLFMAEMLLIILFYVYNLGSPYEFFNNRRLTKK
jgi:4-amino-4-deoxy-L-arabinose transferase and related glycosyltransferases of PMT family